MSNTVLAALIQLVRDLGQIDARWALVGGLAVSARAEPRFTRDVDVCIAVSDDGDAERTIMALTGRGYSVEALVENEYVDRLATSRLSSPIAGAVLVDLLFASSGLESEIVESSEVMEIVPGLSAPVAPSAYLVVLKLLARDDLTRPQDAADLRALRPRLSNTDEAAIRPIAQRVMDRGFHRDRDLVALADAYLTT